MCYQYPIGLAIELDRYQRREHERTAELAYRAMKAASALKASPTGNCTQCGAKSFVIKKSKTICSYCGSDK